MEYLIEVCVNIISSLGYAGVFFLMALESMVAPVPSEAVMPFAGVLWAKGEMSLWAILLASTAGSVAGSLLSYAMGYYGGRPFVKKYGKYLLLSERDLDFAERFFTRHGAKAVFISRFIPVVRHVSSIPAGMGKMSIGTFVVYTAIGAGAWNAILAYAGYHLGNNMGVIGEYGDILDGAVLVVLTALVAVFYKKRRTEATRKKAEGIAQ